MNWHEECKNGEDGGDDRDSLDYVALSTMKTRLASLESISSSRCSSFSSFYIYLLIVALYPPISVFTSIALYHQHHSLPGSLASFRHSDPEKEVAYDTYMNRVEVSGLHRTFFSCLLRIRFWQSPSSVTFNSLPSGLSASSEVYATFVCLYPRTASRFRGFHSRNGYAEETHYRRGRKETITYDIKEDSKTKTEFNPFWSLLSEEGN